MRHASADRCLAWVTKSRRSSSLAADITITHGAQVLEKWSSESDFSKVDVVCAEFIRRGAYKDAIQYMERVGSIVHTIINKLRQKACWRLSNPIPARGLCYPARPWSSSCQSIFLVEKICARLTAQAGLETKAEETSAVADFLADDGPSPGGATLTEKARQKFATPILDDDAALTSHPAQPCRRRRAGQ